MSRSYKKKDIVKDSNKGMKTVGNKKFRRKSKQGVKSGKEVLPKDKSEVQNDYDVCDWKLIDAKKYVGKGKKKRVTK